MTRDDHAMMTVADYTRATGRRDRLWCNIARVRARCAVACSAGAGRRGASPSQHGRTAARRAAPAAAGAGPIAAQRQLRHHRHASIRASRTLTGDELLTWRNTHRSAGHARCSSTSTTTPGATPVDLDARAAARRRRRRSRPRPRADWGWIDVTSLRLIGAGRHRRPTSAAAPLHRARRWQRGRSDGAEVPLDGAGGARARRVNVQIAWTSRVPRTFARTGAIGDFYFIGQWFPKIGVLEDSGLELPPVPRRDRVLRRLRHLRRPAHGAERLDRRRHRRRARTPRRGRRHDHASLLRRTTSTTSPGRRARDYRRADRDVRASDAAAGRDAAAAAARARRRRPTGTSPRRARRCRYYGEWFGAYPYGHITIVDPAWQSGAGGMEYPTLFTAGTRWLAPAAVDEPEGRHGPRSRAPVLVRHRRQQRVRARLDGRGVQHVLDRADARRRRSTPTYYAKRYFGGFVPWVLRRPPAAASDRRQPARRLPPPRRTATCRRRRRGATGRAPPADHLQQDRALAAHARAHARLGDAAADPVDLLRALGVQASEARGLLRRRQRGQRPGPDLVLRSGLPQLERVRLRRRRVHSEPARSRLSRRRQRATFAASATGGSTPPSSCAATATACSRSTSGSSSRTARRCAGSGTARDRWKMFEVEQPVAGASRRRSIRSACCCSTQLHEQLGDARPRGRRPRRAQVVARLAGLAAGSPAHLRLLRLM